MGYTPVDKPAPKKEKKITHRISIKINANTGMLKVGHTPSIKQSKLEDRQILVNGTLAGADVSLQMLLGDLPILRPATEDETDAKIYVFKREEDNEFYNQRKQLYETLATSFTNTLSTLFPDIEYVDSCTKHQQELIFDMTSEEAEEHKHFVEEIVEKVRSVEDEQLS